MIENLPLLSPDASRSAHTAARCHDRLAARRKKMEMRGRPANARAFGVERLLVAGLCVAYLIVMASDLFALAAQL